MMCKSNVHTQGFGFGLVIQSCSMISVHSDYSIINLCFWLCLSTNTLDDIWCWRLLTFFLIFNRNQDFSLNLSTVFWFCCLNLRDSECVWSLGWLYACFPPQRLLPLQLHSFQKKTKNEKNKKASKHIPASNYVSCCSLVVYKCNF